MATHSSTLAWKIPWIGGVVVYSPWGHKGLSDSLTSSRLSNFTFTEIGLSLSEIHPGPAHLSSWTGNDFALMLRD